MVKAMSPVLLCSLFKVHSKYSNRAVALIQQLCMSSYHIAVCYNKKNLLQCIKNLLISRRSMEHYYKEYLHLNCLTVVVISGNNCHLYEKAMDIPIDNKTIIKFCPILCYFIKYTYRQIVNCHWLKYYQWQ